ncbi:MAG: hypothetical protein IKD66_06175 [Solobacterium sp.]|nr:hypothetical protein [Solobacterium sp.]
MEYSLYRRNGVLLRKAAVILFASALLSGCASGTEARKPEEEKTETTAAGMRFEDGMAQPILKYSSAETPNSESEILRYCVYVETDHDTDGDGMADLVKVFVQVPRSAAEGNYKAASIYDPTPYPAGTVEKTKGVDSYPYAEDSFDYRRLYEPGMKRTPAEEVSSLAAAENADPSEYLYSVPDSNARGYYMTDDYDYYLIRGYAVIEACGIGTYGSEGFELCGLDLERDSHKCVVEWLTGDRIAYTDKTRCIAVTADWSNGNVAMTGCSYGGTLPFEVAVTGVKGLKTIIPAAGISNWYEYVNSQGVSIYSVPHYTELLASYNSGSEFLDDNWTVVNNEYGAWIRQTAKDQTEANGNYTDVWKIMDYTRDPSKIQCSALIMEGLNDFNVCLKQADHMFHAFRKAGKPAKLILHQDGHNFLFGKKVNDVLADDLINLWLSHYLYDADNGIETLPEVSVQSNIDGTWKTYDSWDQAADTILHAKTNADTQPILIQNGNHADFYQDYLGPEVDPEVYFMKEDAEHKAVFTLDAPDGITIYGVPKVHVRLSPATSGADNRMVSAVLLDVAADGSPFPAYMTKRSLRDVLPEKTIDTYEFGGGHKAGKLKEFVASPTSAKIISKAWMDLMDPEAGYIPSEDKAYGTAKDGEWYDYTLYMIPKVYTLMPGHQLKLVILAEDPYRARMSDIEDATRDFDDTRIDPEYSFRIDPASVDVELPVVSAG